MPALRTFCYPNLDNLNTAHETLHYVGRPDIAILRYLRIFTAAHRSGTSCHVHHLIAPYQCFPSGDAQASGLPRFCYPGLSKTRTKSSRRTGCSGQLRFARLASVLISLPFSNVHYVPFTVRLLTCQGHPRIAGMSQ